MSVKVNGDNLIGQSILPPGMVVPFAGSTAPVGWLICNGSQYPQTGLYANLYEAIGTTYNADGGTTTAGYFRVPDLRGRVIAGTDSLKDGSGSNVGRLTSASKSAINGATLGAVGGSQEVKLTGAESGTNSHNHGGSTTGGGAHTHYVELDINAPNLGGGSEQLVRPGNGGTGTAWTSPGHDHTINNAAAAAASEFHNNVQPTIVLNYIIKY